MGSSLGGRFICVDLEQLAAKTARGICDISKENLLAVGSSGYKFAQFINPQVGFIEVETLRFDRERDKRSLRVSEFATEKNMVLVDDLAVSGLTLAVAAKSISPTPNMAVVGMLFKSKTTRRLIGANDIRSGLTYTCIGGGRPPINSLASLREYPERAKELAQKYFGVFDNQFCEVINQEGERS